jgi:hypothetical protein
VPKARAKLSPRLWLVPAWNAMRGGGWGGPGHRVQGQGISMLLGSGQGKDKVAVPMRCHDVAEPSSGKPGRPLEQR